MKMRLMIVTALGVVALAAPALAHHAGAMFDTTKSVTVSGTVKDFQWANPHAWIHFMAPGPGGAAVPWTAECSAINIIARKGWTSSALKPGDKVTLTMRPAKDGSNTGLVTSVKLPNGSVLVDHDY